ncbi:MAG: amidohydrolase family protein, partial [Oscillospiraceae bacterium]|nr:amidohydrolase family protein [Oscillospiraceae bacterium]
PSSNMKLGSGFAPIRKMLDAGINVCLGTDGASSNNNLNIFEEMHLAAMICRGNTGDADNVSPKELFKMATVNGAKSQGRFDTGVIKKGNKADLVVLDFNKPHLVPCYDVLTNIVFSAQSSDVALTMVDGDVLYRDGKYKTIDIAKVYDKISYYLPKILAQL